MPPVGELQSQHLKLGEALVFRDVVGLRQNNEVFGEIFQILDKETENLIRSLILMPELRKSVHINECFSARLKNSLLCRPTCKCMSERSSCPKETLRHSIASDKFVKSKPYRHSFVYMINFNGVISLNLSELQKLSLFNYRIQGNRLEAKRNWRRSKCENPERVNLIKIREDPNVKSQRG